MVYKLILPFLLLATTAIAGEREIAQAWIAKHGGTTQAPMPDGSRCDLLSGDYAIEIERAVLWYQAIGQSLWYAEQSGKKAGIILILRDDRDRRYLEKLETLIRQHDLPIHVWTVYAD